MTAFARSNLAAFFVASSCLAAAATAQQVPPPATRPATTAPATAPAALAAQARQVFLAHCYRCHGDNGSSEGGFAYAADLARLVERRKVVPRAPDGSPVVRRMTSRDDPMPPAADAAGRPIARRPTPAEIALVRQWIEAGAPDVPAAVAAAAAPPRALITEVTVVAAISRDLATMDARARPFARYFTLAHLHNAGLPDDELQAARGALSKLVNSLSWERRIVVPLAIDPARTVLRIDLRDLKWNERTWLRVTSFYPYRLRQETPAGRAVYVATGTDQPYVRADWFVFAASRPPLYHELLDVPATDVELERRLVVDAAENVRTERVARAGFTGSGVSQNNRLIERHESAFGGYWKSYDFRAAAGAAPAAGDRKNLFAHPLGPGTGPTQFRHDGGEIIFALPNGLQGYMLTDEKGSRIDRGPIDVVSDPKQRDRTVVNGISCMSCHANGTIEKRDQVREMVLRNAPAYDSATRDAVKALYAPPDAFDRLLRQDAERFARAVEATGAARGGTEPIAALAARHEADLDLPAAAAEVGLTPADFGRRVAAVPGLGKRLGGLNVRGGVVGRSVFDGAYGDVVAALALGEHVPARPQAPPPAPPPAGLPMTPPGPVVPVSAAAPAAAARPFDLTSPEGVARAFRSAFERRDAVALRALCGGSSDRKAQVVAFAQHHAANVALQDELRTRFGRDAADGFRFTRHMIPSPAATVVRRDTNRVVIRDDGNRDGTWTDDGTYLELERPHAMWVVDLTRVKLWDASRGNDWESNLDHERRFAAASTAALAELRRSPAMTPAQFDVMHAVTKAKQGLTP